MSAKFKFWDSESTEAGQRARLPARARGGHGGSTVTVAGGPEFFQPVSEAEALQRVRDRIRGVPCEFRGCEPL